VERSVGVRDSWSGGAAYEDYVGRWSRPVAREFTAWLGIPGGRRWLDVGCGTGALTEAVLAQAMPSEVVGMDPSTDFLGYAAAHVRDRRTLFAVADARALPFEDGSFDAVVSGLVVNFVPDRGAALRELRRVVRADGVVAAYVWDYPDGMQLIRCFWDAAVELDPAARPLHEGVRFDFCRPDVLRAEFTGAGLGDVEVDAVVVPTVFPDFDDCWTPFLSGHAPAPAYARSLGDAHRSALRDALRARLAAAADGSIRLTARAWTVRGSA
jgi:SAM-dependent methyltransferase